MSDNRHGWKCPACKKVWSPHVNMCEACAEFGSPPISDLPSKALQETIDRLTEQVKGHEQSERGYNKAFDRLTAKFSTERSKVEKLKDIAAQAYFEGWIDSRQPGIENYKIGWKQSNPYGKIQALAETEDTQ